MQSNLDILFTALRKAAADDFQFKAKHKNPEGGLSEAGRKAYNRATGGNLKRPQPEGGSRRDSFCARMKGMKKKLTSKETARDPDSRINKSLRKWKCSYDMSEVKEAAKRRGLWANIHAKRERGEAPAKPGDEEYPDKKNWKKVTEESEKEAASKTPSVRMSVIYPNDDFTPESYALTVDSQRILNPEVAIITTQDYQDFLDDPKYLAKLLNMPGVREALESKKNQQQKEAAGRCWKGYKPVPGKEPYSEDSCRLISAGKKKKDDKSEEKKEAKFKLLSYK